jgi:hypothetical protein
MIDGLALDYAGTRAAARLAWRPDERLWQRLHAARDLRALLDAARAAAVGNYLSGLAALARVDEVDAAFRAQFRARVAELGGWVPVEWRAAVRWTAHLPDIAAVAHLWTLPPLRWMQVDPVLGRYASESSSAGARRATLITGPLAPLGRALLAHAAAADAAGKSTGRAPPGTDPAPLPVVLSGWVAHWQSLWPPASIDFGAEARAALMRLCGDVLAHRHRFAQLPPADTAAAREAFATRMLARLRMDTAQPVALFAYLVVLALDLEHLRAECLAQAFDAATAARALAEAA